MELRMICYAAATTAFGMWVLATFVHNGVLVIPIKENKQPTTPTETQTFACDYNALNIPLKVGESRHFLFKNCLAGYTIKIGCDGKECSVKALTENEIREVIDQQIVIPPNPKTYDLYVTITGGKFLTYTLLLDTSSRPF